MRWFLGLWFAPMAFLALWFALASNDLGFGTFFFSRAMYDLIFDLYGNILGVPAVDVPPMILKALVLDSAVVLALFAFRRRKAIAAFARRRSERYGASLPSVESLSSAP